MDFKNATEPLDITDRPIPEDIADLYVAHIKRVEEWLTYKGAIGYTAAGLADMIAEFANDIHAAVAKTGPSGVPAMEDPQYQVQIHARSGTGWKWVDAGMGTPGTRDYCVKKADYLRAGGVKARVVDCSGEVVYNSPDLP